MNIAVTTELYHEGCMLFNAYDNPVGFITTETGVFYPLAELKARDIDAAELELDSKGSNEKPAVYMEDVLIQHVIEGEVDTYDTDVEVTDVKIMAAGHLILCWMCASTLSITAGHRR